METTVGLQKEVSCRVINSVLKYVESLGYNVDSIVEGLPYSREYLTDPFNWVPYGTRETVCQRAATLVNDEALMYKVGLATPKLSSLGGLEHLVRLLGSPKLVYKSVPKYAAFLDRVFSFTVKVNGDNRAVVTMSMTRDYPPSQNACYFAQGILAAIPTVWGLPPAEVKEEKCMCHPSNGRGREGVEYGAGVCAYQATWQVTHPWYLRLPRLLLRRGCRTSETISEMERHFGLMEQKNAELVRRNNQLAKVREIAVGLGTASTADEVLNLVVKTGSAIPGVSSVIVQQGALRNSNQEAADTAKTVVVPLTFDDRLWGSLTFSLEGEVAKDILEMVGSHCATAIKSVTATKALLESEEKYRALVDNANEAIIVLNPEGVVAFANPKATSITGYSREELTAGNILELIHPEDREPLTEWYRSILQGHKSPLLQLLRITTKGGGIRWIKTNTVLITWENRPASLNLLTDVTKSKEVEELYQTLANSSPVGVYIVQDGRFQFVNPRFQEYTGYTGDELLGMDALDIVHPEDREGVRQNAVEMLKGERLAPYEFRYIRKSGETIWAMETTTPIRYKGERATLGNFMDITERKEVEKRLRESRKRFTDLVNFLPQTIFEHDKEGNLTFANRHAALTYGYPLENITEGITTFDTVVPEDRERVRENFQRVLNGEELGGVEYTGLRKDGSAFPMLTFAAPIIRDGKPVGLRGVTIDITERKQAEEKLEESWKRHLDMVNMLPQTIFELDETGNLTFANREGTLAFGYTLEDIQNGLNAMNFFVPEERDRVIEDLRGVLRGEVMSGVEYTALRKDGSTFPVLIYGSPIVRGGETVGLRGVIVDITERKRADEALRESRRRYIDLINFLPQTIFEHDEKGNLSFANRQGALTFGYTLDDVRNGLTGVQMYIPEDRDRVYENWLRVLSGEDLGGIEYTALRKDGSTFPVVVYYSRITRGDKTTGLRGVIIDITERKRAEAELKTQKELIDRILASTPNSVLVVDGHYQVVLANKEFYNYFDMKAGDVEGRPIDEVIHIKGLSKAIREASGSRQPQLNLEFRYKAGDIAGILAISITPMQDEEILLILRDITDERERDERLYLTDRLASIGAMAAGIAHELNNPLSGVVALSQLLVESNLPDEVKEDVQDIHSEARRAAGIVKNLLTFSRKHKSGRQLTQINDVIEDVLRLRAYEQKVKGIQVSSNLDSNLPEIVADYFQMQQVFLNIVLNAESSMASNSSHAELDVTTERVDGTVRVSFTDNGPGIPKEILSRIFDPFFTTKEVGQGTGLGLSISYGIVAEHGGRLYAESEVGKGATFIVEIPIKAQRPGKGWIKRGDGDGCQT